MQHVNRPKQPYLLRKESPLTQWFCKYSFNNGKNITILEAFIHEVINVLHRNVVYDGFCIVLKTTAPQMNKAYLAKCVWSFG